MTITPERIAELRRVLTDKDRSGAGWGDCLGCGKLTTRCHCDESLAQSVPDLLDEIERLRAVIRETHGRDCVGGFHAPACKLYEIEP